MSKIAATVDIPSEDILFHPTSFCDEDGRVFWWNGELYRGISARYAPLCQKLFDTGVVDSLIRSGFLIETELTDLALPTYPLVLKHRALPFVTYASEWCPEMLREAAQFTLDMMRHLASDNLTVDVGTWDILFEGCRPRYVDFCSIAAVSTYDRHTWNGVLDDFLSYFVNPLTLMSQGKGNLARWLLLDYEHRVVHAELAALMGQRIYGQRRPRGTHSIIRKLREKLADKLDSQRDPCRLNLIQKMQRSLNKIQLPPPAFEPQAAFDSNKKSESLCQLLATLQPATILDLGCGCGDRARVAAASGAQVIAIDRDDRQVARCYQTAKAQGLSILPLVMDIRYPTAAQGTGKPVLAAAAERLQCELVMALDILHLLVFEQHLTLAQAVEAIATFSTRWLIVEFSTPAPALSRSDFRDSAFYNLQALLSLLQRQFQDVSLIPLDHGNAPLILCKR